MASDLPAAAEAPNGDFSVGPEQLAVLVKDRNVEALEQYGGVKGVADMLQSNLVEGSRIVAMSICEPRR